MISEYTFYYGYEKYPIEDKPVLSYKVNNHKISKEVYHTLFRKVANSSKHDLFTIQNTLWENYHTNSCIQTSISTYGRRIEDN